MRTIPTLTASLTIATALIGCDQFHHRSAPPQAQIRSRSVNPGAKALAALQSPDGSFARADAGPDVGVTALAGLALLSADDGHSHNPYAANVRKVTQFLLAQQNDRGLIGTLGSGTSMYGHGFATLYLSQVYAFTEEGETSGIRAALEKAVRLTETAQNAEGGWGYATEPGEADVSVSTGQLKALLAAQQIGIRVNQKTIDNALGYIRRMQNEDGGFRYNATERASVWARSAAAVATLLYTGAVDDKAVRAGIDYLSKQATPDSPNKRFQYYYGNYYLAQALSLAPKGERLSYDQLVQSIMDRQDRATGLWRGDAGEAYATATALIVLQMRGTALPAFKPR